MIETSTVYPEHINIALMKQASDNIEKLQDHIAAVRKINLEHEAKEDALREYIKENSYRMNDTLREIAEMFEIELTKEISGTATYEISWTATVPLDFDAQDFDISFDAMCDSHEADDFDFTEDFINVRTAD